MQTFLPVDNFKTSVECLDNMRLGKQRVEAMQIINALTTGKGWVNHPATKMWRNHIPALMYYHDLCIEEWVSRGFNNTMKMYHPEVESIIYPEWFGNEDFHRSHQSNLLRKANEALNKSHRLYNIGKYSQYSRYLAIFKWYTKISEKHHWTTKTNLPYIWPV